MKPESKIVRRGCNNDVCFCTGACQEVIGYYDEEGKYHAVKTASKLFVQEVKKNLYDGKTKI